MTENSIESQKKEMNKMMTLGYLSENDYNRAVNALDNHGASITKRSFDESKHDRSGEGKFTPKGQGGGKKPKEGKKPKDHAKPEDAEKKSKKEANYTGSSTKKGQQCSNCINILRKKNDPNNRCTKVDGIVSDNGWSSFYKPSKKSEDPTKV